MLAAEELRGLWLVEQHRGGVGLDVVLLAQRLVDGAVNRAEPHHRVERLARFAKLRQQSETRRAPRSVEVHKPNWVAVCDNTHDYTLNFYN